MKIALLILFLTISHAAAHEAIPTADKPLGWSYPFYCCSGYDCRMVPPSAISEPTVKRNSYIINSTGEVIELHDTRLKDSPDGEFHWCSVAGANDTRTICLYIPPKGF